jgi:general stress protein 26
MLYTYNQIGWQNRVKSVSHPTEQALNVIYDNLHIATIDEKGDPNIQPVWFYFDEDEGKLLIITSKSAKKTQNLKNRPFVYFSIDDESPPSKELKVKGMQL